MFETKYSSNTFFTAYRIPLYIWHNIVDIHFFNINYTIFETMYDIIKYIKRKYPYLNKYSSDTFSTAYRIPLYIWHNNVDIPIYQIFNINKKLKDGEISIFDGKVILSY